MHLVLVGNLLMDQQGLVAPEAPQPPLGLLSLVAQLRVAGIQASLFDPAIPAYLGELKLGPDLRQQLTGRVLALAPDVVGFTTLGCNFPLVVSVARRLRELRPDLPLILGGPHATVLDTAILTAFPQFDVIARHECEPTIVDLVHGLWHGGLDRVPGLSYRRIGKVFSTPNGPIVDDVDKLPMPAYDTYPIDELQLSSLRVEAGRGCPFACRFCSTAEFFGRRFRVKSATRLRREMEELQRTYRIRRFSLQHDLFTVDRHKVREFCEEIEGLDFEWTCSARVDCVDEDLLRAMSRAGCRGIFFGIETGSTRLQQLVDKRLDLALVEPTVALAQELSIHPTLSFITGFPQETREDQRATLDMVDRCVERADANTNIQLHLLTPEPGTPMLRDFEHTLQFDGFVTDAIFPLVGCDDAELVKQHPSVFLNYWYYAGVVSRQRHLAVVSSYHTLRRLGWPALQHLLWATGKKLTDLLDQMVDWADKSTRAAPLTDDCLEEFLRDCYVDEAYLQSLVRYLLQTGKLLDTVNRRDSEGTPGSHLRLSQYALVFDELHDCGEIVRRLEDSPCTPLPEPLLERTSYQLAVRRSRASDRLQNFEIDPTTASLLHYLDSPRSLTEIGRRMTHLHISASTGETLLDSLLTIGAVVAE